MYSRIKISWKPFLIHLRQKSLLSGQRGWSKFGHHRFGQLAWGQRSRCAIHSRVRAHRRGRAEAWGQTPNKREASTYNVQAPTPCRWSPRKSKLWGARLFNWNRCDSIQRCAQHTAECFSQAWLQWTLWEYLNWHNPVVMWKDSLYPGLPDRT